MYMGKIHIYYHIFFNYKLKRIGWNSKLWFSIESINKIMAKLENKKD